MQTVELYLYYPTVHVLFIDDASIETRNRQVYSATQKIYKKADNPIRFIVKNQDMKPVNIASIDFQVELVDDSDSSVVQTYTPTVISASRGIMEITVENSDIAAEEKRFYHLVVKRLVLNDDSTWSEYPTYIDDNYSVRLPVELLEGYPTYG